MEVKQVPLQGSGFRGKMLNDYLTGDVFLQPFYAFKPSLNSFAEAIAARSEKEVNRNILTSELAEQHKAYSERFPLVKENIELLKKENTFTVTTGHQLCIAGGPLFFVYKLITVINLATELRQRYPGDNFIPVFWMATEDHDFAEIAGLDVNGMSLQWKHTSGSATGRMDTSGLDILLGEIELLIKNLPGASRIISAYRQAYSKSNLADATREFVLEFFGNEGLIVLDADSAKLKKEFSTIIKEELFTQASFSAVNVADKLLEERYASQVHPREINLFYLTDEKRSRIVRANDHFEVLDTNLRFTADELRNEVDLHPEKFSPNVILRPVYQETILPNLAYVGGPAEISYWLQFKKVFEAYKTFYPVLIPRNHALILEQKPWKHWVKQELSYADLFKNKDKVINQAILKLSGNENILGSSRAEIDALYNSIEKRIVLTDTTLSPVVKAALQKAMNGLDKIERKNLAALRRRHEIAVRQLTQVIDIVKPAGVPQERVASFVYMYAMYSDALLHSLKASMKPFSDTLTVIHP